jgi:hypothetical protein
MDCLPNDIADLCGIRMDHSTRAPASAKHMTPALAMVESEDGVITVEYNGATLGWINKIRLDRRDGAAYRATAVCGTVRHCYSMAGAKAWLIEEAI